MSYQMQIERAELTVKEGKTKEEVVDILEQMEVLPPLVCRGMEKCTVVEPKESSFGWDEAVYAELLLLSEICNGHIEVTGEESEHNWFEIQEGVVKELQGRVVYEDAPSLTFDGNNPIIRAVMFYGVFSDDRIIVSKVGYENSSYILVDRKEIRYMTFYSMTAGLLQLLIEYAEAGESTLENRGWLVRNPDRILSKELIGALAEKGFETEAVALKLAYQ